MFTLVVGAVADGDERCDASPDIDAAAPERLGVTMPDTGDDDGDRPAAPIASASLCTSPVLLSARAPARSPQSLDRLTAKPDSRSSFTSPSPSAAPARARPCADDDVHRNADRHGALTSAAADVARQLTPQDELQALVQGSRARPASAPSPMATSAATPCPTPVTPRLNGSVSPRPTFATTMAIGQLS